ncbi:juvenile hormone acid O-methyltransferase isoform X2 [Camponotus floridanus]|uniref:juvenile hormone acid O-methyltransferase isoform X2 n=1 Tax=Camponotus floridanus TaxID=104421 RepID=UPI000DC6A5AA|nr:juvenile hormone acid O-methyltransferase isoform X2 [Camponotus floridanus]
MVEPAQYSLFDNECKKNVSSLLNEFAKELKNISGKCMDIGSGPGDITKEILLPFLDPNATMIGIDIMEKMVKYANETYGDGKRLKFEVLDIQTKNLPEKYISKFDHIFSFHTLQWCNDIRQTFKNIYCMLRPGKTMLILSIAHHTIFYESLKVIMQDMRFASYMKDKKKYAGFHHSVQPDKELKEILENIGFQVHHCSHREINSFLSVKKFPWLSHSTVLHFWSNCRIS